MFCGKNFFQYGKLLKLTPNMLVFSRYRHIYKVYKIENLSWFREIVFLKRAENMIKDFKIRKLIKSVDVCPLDSFQFVTKKNYDIVNEDICILNSTQDYCVLKFKYIKSNKLTIRDISENIHEIIFLLAFLNKKYIIHRDIKEANILAGSSLFEGKKIYFIDFNMSTMNGIKNNNFATKEYKDPILYRSISVDERTDVWSFGILLFNLLTNSHITDFITESQLHDAEVLPELILQDPRLRNTDSGSLISRVIGCCLQKYENRPTFAGLFDKFRDEFPKQLADVLDSILVNKLRTVTIKNAETKKAIKFIEKFNITDNEKYYFKKLIEYLFTVAEIESPFHIFSVFVTVKIISDMRRNSIDTYVSEFLRITRTSISKKMLIENIKNILILCDSDIITKMF